MATVCDEGPRNTFAGVACPDLEGRAMIVLVEGMEVWRLKVRVFKERPEDELQSHPGPLKLLQSVKEREMKSTKY